MSDTTEPSTPWMLKSIQVAGLPERLPVKSGDTTLGRSPTNDIVLAEAEYPEVSAHHARLRHAEDGTLKVTDLGSRNGTLLNGEPVEEAKLHDGDILQLGPSGPRFLCEETNSAAVTRFFTTSRTKSRSGASPDFRQSTVFRVKRALGLAPDADVGELFEKSETRSKRRLALTVTASLLLVGCVVWMIYKAQDDEIGRLRQGNRELQAQLSKTTTSFEQQQEAWEHERGELVSERQNLQTKIADLSAREQTSSSELAKLNERLAATDRKLQRYDPIRTEQARMLRQERIEQIQRAVVFVETKFRFRSMESNELLRIVPAEDPDEDSDIALGNVGEPFERESSGSGFCIREDGSVITNAHVIQPEGFNEIIPYDGNNLQPELEHFVVFSGTSKRHPAEIIKVLDEGDEDLALLRIKPFEGMPHLTGFKVDVPTPPTMSDVYLHGFPLGKRALQEGDTVIASSFRGILSRQVSNWLQVDAAVHPGNSGGPLTDSNGNVIGVVCRVQRISDETIAPDMGYAIPIQEVGRLLVEDTQVQNASADK